MADEGVILQPSAADKRGLIIKGAVSQSANLLEVRKSDDTVLWKLDSDGRSSPVQEYEDTVTCPIDDQSTYTLTYTPKASSDVKVYFQGVYWRNGTHFSVSGDQLTWGPSAPNLSLGDILLVRYEY